MSKELIYVGDPMCSWCWGFAPTLKSIRQQNENRVNVTMMVGGLHPGTTEPQTDNRKQFLRKHWEEVTDRSGQQFSYDILMSNDFVYDTEPPCRAIVTMRLLKPEVVFDYFVDVQKSFYVDNLDITKEAVLTIRAEQFGVDSNEFAEQLSSPKMKEQTKNDFATARSLGVTGFPTVVAKDNDRYAYLTIGYQPFDSLQPIIEGWLTDAYKL